MTTLDVTDHEINYRPDNAHGPYYPVWGLSSDGKPIGTVWETERGYAGQIQGENAQGQYREYTCPALPFRQSVIDQLGEMAERIGLA